MLLPCSENDFIIQISNVLDEADFKAKVARKNSPERIDGDWLHQFLFND